MHHAGLALMLEPVALASNWHDMRMMRQSIEQRRCQCRVLRQRGVPLPKGQVAGHDEAAFFIQRSDDLEEQIGLLSRFIGK